jgi:hypothetical protein
MLSTDRPLLLMRGVGGEGRHPGGDEACPHAASGARAPHGTVSRVLRADDLQLLFAGE